MTKSTVAYQEENNSFQRFLQWTNEKEVLGGEINKYIKPEYESLLDIGAGNGSLTKYYINQFKRVTLLEPSKPLYQELKVKFPQATIHNTSIESFVDLETYDFIVASHVFIYIKNPEQILQKIYQALNSNGLIIIIMLDKTGEYLKYIDAFASKINVKLTETGEYRWENIIDYLGKQKITYLLKDIDTSITAPSLQDFMSINDFHFNTDVSHLSQRTLEEMSCYLKKYSSNNQFEIQVRHKSIAIYK